MLVRTGVHLKVFSERLGHASIGITPLGRTTSLRCR